MANFRYPNANADGPGLTRGPFSKTEWDGNSVGLTAATTTLKGSAVPGTHRECVPHERRVKRAGSYVKKKASISIDTEYIMQLSGS